VRLDLFLKASRLCPRRTVAQTLCDANQVLLNDRPAKSAHVVKPGDELTLRRRNRETKVRVLIVPAVKQTSREQSTKLYEVIHEVELNDA
jgi:ribosomal 50S subunit-recycling heat shock protein